MGKRSAQDDFINAEMILKIKGRELDRAINKTKKEEKKEADRLGKMMAQGDEEMIDGQAQLLCDYQGQIREMTLRRQKFHQFEVKMRSARTNIQIGNSMVQVAQVMSRFSQNVNLESVEDAMNKLDKQYDDINVMTKVLDNATQQGSAVTARPEEVERIKRQVADAHGLNLKESLGVAPVSETPTGPTKEEEEASNERLRALREMA